MKVDTTLYLRIYRPYYHFPIVDIFLRTNIMHELTIFAIECGITIAATIVQNIIDNLIYGNYNVSRWVDTCL